MLALTGGNAGEAVTKGILERAYSSDKGYTIMEQVAGKFSDGSSTIFDFVILDENGDVVQTIETKANKGRMTTKQKQYYRAGQDVELQISGHRDNRNGDLKNTKINKASVDAKMHKVGIDRVSGRKTKSSFKKIK